MIPIPTNRPMVREDQPDLVYRTEDAKYAAIVDDISERHAEGQPMLVGTVSVEKSEHLSSLLKRRGIPHTVLNAKQHASEAHIVAQAGRKGAVTVATNMAGRGTDIMLGGSVEFLADEELRGQGLDPVEHSDEYEAAWPAMLEQIKEQVEAEHDEVNDVGGLYVIGTERHESRRIDNQLRGRSGRQGDPGESRFYLSLEDDLMRLFKSDWVDWVLTTMKIPDDVPIENKRVTGAIASAQAQVESQNFETRKNILKYDDVMSRQREVVYGERRQVLEGADLHEQIRGMIDDTIDGYVAGATEGFPEDWDLDAAVDRAQDALPGLAVDRPGARGRGRRRRGPDRDVPRGRPEADAHAAYDAREEALGAEVLRELERRVLLSVLDRKWREHLYEMDYLREGIGLRAYSQRDPLVEYQREGFELFYGDDGLDQGGVGRLPVQRRGADRARGRRGPGRRCGTGRRRGPRTAGDPRGRACRARRPPTAHPGQGSRGTAGAEEPLLLRADGRRRRGHRRSRPTEAERRVRWRLAQRAVPVWVRARSSSAATATPPTARSCRSSSKELASSGLWGRSPRLHRC